VAELEKLGCTVKKVGRGAVKDEASYVCYSCGEEIVVPIDLSAGGRARIRRGLSSVLLPERRSRRSR
jgi:hypothetical protein